MTQQETQLSLTNRAMHIEVSQGHHNTVPFYMLSTASYQYAIIILSLRYALFFRYSTFKNGVSLKPGLGVRQGHCYNITIQYST